MADYPNSSSSNEPEIMTSPVVPSAIKKNQAAPVSDSTSSSSYEPALEILVMNATNHLFTILKNNECGLLAKMAKPVIMEFMRIPYDRLGLPLTETQLNSFLDAAINQSPDGLLIIKTESERRCYWLELQDVSDPFPDSFPSENWKWLQVVIPKNSPVGTVVASVDSQSNSSESSTDLLYKFKKKLLSKLNSVESDFADLVDAFENLDIDPNYQSGMEKLASMKRLLQ